MGYIRKKDVKGYTYHYYVEKKRVNGKPVDSVHVYLGTANEIMRKITGSGANESTHLKSFEYGKIASLLAVDEELGFRDLVNSEIEKRHEKGFTPADYILLTIFGRWCGPLSKSAIGEHFKESFLGFSTSLPHKVNAQNIIAHMEYLDKETIRRIETRIGIQLKKRGIVPDMVVWDTTNNYTFIDAGESIPKKGKSKQGRQNKNLIGLGLAVSGDNIPIFHETVPGNTHDAPLFSRTVEEIIARLKMFDVNPKDMVIVIDKGNNDVDTFNSIKDSIHILGSLKKNQVPDLFDVPLEKFKDIYDTHNETTIKGYEVKREIYGRTFSVVISYNPDTHKRQYMTYLKAKERVLSKLNAIRTSMSKKGRGRKPTIQSSIKRAVKIIPEQYSTALKYNAWADEFGNRFDYWVDEKAEKNLFKGFGKIAIFTDKLDWPMDKVAMTYNRKVFIENDFHWLKDKLLIPVTPIWHRRDDNIRAHVFLCVMGLLFVRYLSLKVRKLGITDEQLMSELSKIRVALVSDNKLKKPRIVVEEMTPLQSRLFSMLDLGRYLNIEKL